jgi:hypothetical protein
MPQGRGSKKRGKARRQAKKHAHLTQRQKQDHIVGPWAGPLPKKAENA